MFRRASDDRQQDACLADEAQKFIKSVEAKTHSTQEWMDTPEDLTGGLAKALTMTWKAITKIAIVVADAPCHGTRFHDLLDDKYPNGTPGHDVENILQEYNKRGIDVYCFDVHKDTHKMLMAFTNAYDTADRKLHIVDMKADPSHFKPAIIRSVTQSMVNSAKQSLAGGPGGPNPPDFSS